MLIHCKINDIQKKVLNHPLIWCCLFFHSLSWKKGTHTGFSSFFWVLSVLCFWLKFAYNSIHSGATIERILCMVFFRMRWIPSISLPCRLLLSYLTPRTLRVIFLLLTHSLFSLSIPTTQSIENNTARGFFFHLAVFLLIFIILLDLFFALNEHDSKMNEAVTPLHLHMRMMLMRDGYIAVIIP